MLPSRTGRTIKKAVKFLKKIATRKGHFDKNPSGGKDARKFNIGGRAKKNWIQSVNKSIKKRGTKGKCTPITKKGCTGRAKALAMTFKKMAKKRKGK